MFCLTLLKPLLELGCESVGVEPAGNLAKKANDKGFEPVNISYGHNNGNPKEPIVYIVIYWMNSNGESFASVSTPETSEVCIVFRTFNLQINPNLIKSYGLKT